MGPLPFPAGTVSPQQIAPEALPRPRPLQGPFKPNTALHAATRLFEGRIHGSESVAVAADGTLWMLDKWGYAWTAKATSSASSSSSAAAAQAGNGAAGGSAAAAGQAYELSAEPVAYVGPGRPLGFEFDAEGNLLICDSLKGLMLLERAAQAGAPGGPAPRPGSHWRLRCLCNWANGRPVSYANDLDVASDGRIFFSDSTVIAPALNEALPKPWYDTMRSFVLTVLHGAPTGRLLVHSPADGSTQELCSGLWFANGVALAPDESFVAVVETCSMRVHRYWLAGPKAGTRDILIDQLPGWPDNIVRSQDGNFWLCLVVPDSPPVRKLMPRPWLRSLYAALPEWLLPPKPQWGCVCKVSPAGEVLQVLMDPTGSHVSHISCVSEHDGNLFIGNLAKDYVSIVDLKQVAAGTVAAAGGAAAAAAAK